MLCKCLRLERAASALASLLSPLYYYYYYCTAAALLLLRFAVLFSADTSASETFLFLHFQQGESSRVCDTQSLRRLFRAAEVEKNLALFLRLLSKVATCWRRSL